MAPEEIVWERHTPLMRALQFDFVVRTSKASIGRYLETLLAGLIVSGETEREVTHYSFIDREGHVEDRYQVHRDGELVISTNHPSVALKRLLWDINRGAIETARGVLLLHAAAAEREGRALLFPASSGSGKTTLVAGLVRAGLRYVTDEAVALEPATLVVQPYPKPLGIDQGSWSVLSSLRPEADPELQGFNGAGWHVPPDAIRRGAVAPPSRPRYVIAPRYVRGSRTECLEMRRSEALIALAEHSFNTTQLGARRTMEVLAAVVRACRCYRLVIGDLDEACAAVLGLLDSELPLGADR